ncbi:hypothetical protein H9Q69_013227 [Fusarium xylarioides]|nr:hypothetical protein H9Q69_013227 [Fusarium xylarioides]
MEQDPLSCDHCGERFQRREHRNRHVLRHTGLKPFQCNICSKSFSRRARRDDGDTIVVGESSQDIAASSPLTAQGADFQEDAFLPGDIHPTPDEWDNLPSIPPDTSGMPPIASSTIYTTVPDIPSNWPNVPALPVTFTLNGGLEGLGNMTGNPWMPWNSSMAQFSFPWFMNELKMPVELPDIPHPHDDAVHHVTQQTETGLAYLIPGNICSTFTQPCHPFPEPKAIGLQMAGAEVFGHTHEIHPHAVEGLNNFYETQRRDSTPTAIPQDVLHAFVELYFEYFDAQYPFLHPSRLEDPNLQWILLLAVAAVGSHYSEIQGADEYNAALCDLLARAVEKLHQVHDSISNIDVVTVECVFLLHALWLFSGSHQDKIVLQHKRSSLATMCMDLVGKADKRRKTTQTEPHTEEVWQAWITEESELRLVTCVRALECLSHIFLGTPLVFNLRDATRQLPCPGILWRSHNASEWKSRQESSTGIVIITANSAITSLIMRENALLDTMIDQLTLNSMPNPGYCTDTIFHVIAILRLIPLETLHSATGWETNKEQMIKSKQCLKDHFENSDVKARKGLWHATCIFKTTQSSRRLACYDALSLTVAMGYIYCYSETRTALAQISDRPLITRLDQLQDREAIERWIENGGDSVVHLTGVGILDGSDHCVRFLRDLERTLVSQIAWRGFCRAFASSFAQLRRGETPTKTSREYNNVE